MTAAPINVERIILQLPIFVKIKKAAPNRIKKAIVGVGHADKHQVEHMVKMQLPGVVLNGVDATDALAIALCHAHYGCSSSRYQVVTEKVL